MVDRLALLDVGHGNAALLHSDKVAIVIDAGRGVGLLEYLRSEEIEQVSSVIISHADADHLRGLVGLLGVAEIEVLSVALNSDAAKSSRQWNALAFDLDDRRRRGQIQFSVELVEGTEFSLSNDVAVQIVAPRSALAMLGPGSQDSQGRRIGTNTISAVARITAKGSPIALLTGDLDEVGLDHLISAGVAVDAPLLVFPHHGGNVSGNASVSRNVDFAKTLSELVSPEVVVFSIGRGSFANPRPEIVEAVRRTSPGVRIMCTQLSTHCADMVPSQAPPHLLDQYAEGRRQRHCCAGTIVVALDPFDAAPDKGHSAFISLHAPTALCRKSPNSVALLLGSRRAPATNLPSRPTTSARQTEGR